MKLLLGLAMSLAFTQSAAAANCTFYKDADRGGTSFEQSSAYKLSSTWTKQVSSVWVKSGYHAVLFDQNLFKGNKIYIYGTGIAFAKNQWSKASGKIVDGGASYNLNDFSFNEAAASVLCLKV